MAVTLAGANNSQPRFYGSLSGAPYRLDTTTPIAFAGVVPGDFVYLVAGVWTVYADSNSANLIGGIFLGRDAGTGSNTGGSLAAINSPGIDLQGTGIFRGDGATAALASAANAPGAVLVLSPDSLIEVDINANLTMTTVIPGAVVGSLAGSTFVAGTATSGWGFDLNANAVVQSQVRVHEILVNPTASLRGRMVVRFHDPTKLSPGG